MNETPRRRSVPDLQPARRAVLKLMAGAGLALPIARVVGAQDDARRKARPQTNDRFVFAGGDRKGQLITVADLAAGGPPLTAYPMDPTARIVRDESRLNQILLVRLEPSRLNEDTRTDPRTVSSPIPRCAPIPVATSGTGSPHRA